MVWLPGTRKMRDGLAPFLGQRQRFAATIDRIGVKDGWRSAITVLLKDVALADTGDVVADHLWLRLWPLGGRAGVRAPGGRHG